MHGESIEVCGEFIVVCTESIMKCKCMIRVRRKRVMRLQLCVGLNSQLI